MLVAAAAGAVVLRDDEVYQSRVLMSIDQPVALVQATDGGLLDKLSRLRIKYADLVPTPEIAEDAAEALGLPVGRVAGSVSAEVPQLTLTVVIRAQAGDPTMAVDIANAVAASLVDYVDDELERADVDEDQRYEFRILVPAVAAPQVEPTTDDAIQASVSFGLLALGAVYIMLELLDGIGRRRNPEI